MLSEVNRDLLKACESGDMEKAQQALENGANSEVKESDGWTPLFLASRAGHDAIISLLLENGTNVNAKDKWGNTPLHHASQKGYETIVSLLLENRAEVNAIGEWGNTPLHLACLERREAVISLLLEHGADVNHVGLDRYTPLHWASQKGYTNIVSLLLEHSANVNAKDSNENTPLHMASWKGHVNIVSLLLENGADPNVADKDGVTPLRVAQDNENQTCVAAIEKYLKQQVLYDASKNGDLEEAKRAIEKGANVKAKDENGDTPLHFASANGNSAIALLLLEYGADVNSQNTYGVTPLHIAGWNGHDAVVLLLLDNGANVNVQKNDGDTALHKVCRYGRDSLVKLLLEHNADFSITNAKGHTPFQVAQECDKQDCADAIEGFRQVQEGTMTPMELKIKQLPEDIQRILTCPISGDIMKDPVILFPSGKTFNRESLCTWLLHNPTPRCPWTNQPLDRHMTYVENREIRDTLIYYLGEEAYVRFDDTDFKDRYQALWNAQHANSLFDIGLDYEDDDQFYVAEEYYQQAATLRHSGAQYNLAMLNEDNHERMLGYLEQAVGQDHPEALYYLGTLYYNSDVVRQDLTRAREYFQRAAAQGNSEAQDALEHFPEVS
jgi:ankyrin repeat protein